MPDGFFRAIKLFSNYRNSHLTFAVKDYCNSYYRMRGRFINTKENYPSDFELSV